MYSDRYLVWSYVLCYVLGILGCFLGNVKWMIDYENVDVKYVKLSLWN